LDSVVYKKKKNVQSLKDFHVLILGTYEYSSHLRTLQRIKDLAGCQ
jgi:hypothetical protein